MRIAVCPAHRRIISRQAPDDDDGPARIKFHQLQTELRHSASVSNQRFQRSSRFRDAQSSDSLAETEPQVSAISICHHHPRFNLAFKQLIHTVTHAQGPWPSRAGGSARPWRRPRKAPNVSPTDSYSAAPCAATAAACRARKRARVPSATHGAEGGHVSSVSSTIQAAAPLAGILPGSGPGPTT